MTPHKRRFERVDSLNLLSYICYGKDGQEKTQGMGRTLNVSEGGILLETHVPIDPEHNVFLSIGLDDEVSEVKGKVAFSKPGDNDRYQTGLEFTQTDAHSRDLIKRYVEAFLKQEKSTEAGQ